MIKKRLNIRMSGLGGQGAVTAAHVLAMAANRDGKFSISNPFFGAEKRMAPAESYCRIGIERIYSIVLTTGNKSEMATGYCTLYGDMAGGFAVIKDVAKTLVYRLCEWKNRQPTALTNGRVGEVIPQRILTRAPSAELRADQRDQDSLPPYEVLDAVVQRYMEGDESIEQIIASGYERADVERVTRLIKLNEYKRRQAPVGIRITHRAFGRDWRYPITSKFRA